MHACPFQVRMIMTYIDEDGSGTIEYNEFAPLMFNWMVEALKLGFLGNEVRSPAFYTLPRPFMPFHALR